MTLAQRFDRLAAATRALHGRRRALIALALGVGATLALPPAHLIALLIPAFVGLAWLVEGAGSTRRAFWVGWWFGVGHFTTGLYWVSEAFLVDAERFAWMIPIALGGLGTGLALFTGLATAIAHALRARLAIATPFALALGWLAGEWLRGHVLTGFPWNLVASGWTVVPPLGGAGRGAYGLGAAPVAAASASGRPRGAAVAATLIAAAFVAGELRQSAVDAESVPGVVLRLVQPDIPQSLKWDPKLRESNLLGTIDLTATAGLERVTHVIWAETATMFPIADNAELRRALAKLAPPGGVLLTGAVRVEREPTVRAWNSLHALAPDGEIVATYDKFHLVPFGEYVPLRHVLPLSKITPGDLDFSVGPGPRTLSVPGLPPFSPLICYEIIFPGAVVDARDRPAWILNVTNDGWFGMSAGPYQHFAAARLRAIEEGLPVVRVANGGISAVIDPYGRVLASLPLGVRGGLDHYLPRPLPPTLYARFGDLVLVPLALALLALGALAGRTRRLKLTTRS